MKSTDIRAVKANHVTWVGFFVNLILVAFKLVAGMIGNSAAMIADALHSLSDFATDASKEWLYRYTAGVGREINSQAVIANAWHHRSDSFSSIGTMLGIGGATF